jgi:crotonobetaine/carnitine-CoA ligase
MSDESDAFGNLTLADLIAHQSTARTGQTFVVHEDPNGRVSKLGYSELEQLTNAFANTMLGEGLEPGDRVLLMMTNNIPFVISMLGCAKAGLVAVPVNTGYVVPEVAHVIELVEPHAYVVDEGFIDLLLDADTQNAFRVGCIVGTARTDRQTIGTKELAWQELLAGAATAPRHRAQGEDVHQLIMTSGTTARPKAVMRTQVNCLWSAYRFAMQARLTPADRNLTALPGFHVNCLDQTLFSSLASGATVVLLERYRATRFMEQVRRHRATVISLVPMLIRTILAQPPSPSDNEHCLRLAIGGLQLTREELDTFERRFGLPVPILGGYGLTEASTNVTLTVLGGDPRWPSIGLPAIDRTVMLVDEDGQSVPVGETGEVIVRGVPGRSLMKGYWRDPEATAAALRDGWLYTGDLAKRDEDGYFYFVDRKKDMIKVSGENVAALEVERVLLEHPAIADVAVVGVADELRDEAVKAFVVLEPGSRLDLDTLRLYCEPKLARFKVPTLLETLDELPRATIGKVDKGALRGRGRSQDDG